MLRFAVTLVVAVSLAGCGTTGFFTKEPDQVCLPLDKARQTWATVSTLGKDRFAEALARCAANQLSAADCVTITSDQATAKQLDFQVRTLIDNPKAVVDWDKIIELAQIAAGIGGKLSTTAPGGAK